MTTAPPTRVVVADDSGLMRRVLSHALSDAGFDVVGQAQDGDEALALCRRLRPDTMTLDLHMPGMDGIGVLRELKRPGAPSIPVIVVSAFSPAHGARAVDALSEGAFDLVAKPGAGDALSAFVAELSDKVLLGPGGLHLRLDPERRAVLSDDAPIGGLRPRADLAIEDAAKLFGRRLLLVVLTGMGNDGVAGARAVRAHGGRVLVQEESTCTVYGMPRAVAEAGLADAVFGLDDLPAAIAREVGA